MYRLLKVYEFSNLGFYQMFGLKVESELGDVLGWNSEIFVSVIGQETQKQG
jgi:hypothetical protein